MKSANGWPQVLPTALVGTRSSLGQSRSDLVLEQGTEKLEIVGEPGDLPDAFFDALASLLLSVNETKDSELDAEEPVA
jgi:hypothetical protein